MRVAGLVVSLIAACTCACGGGRPGPVEPEEPAPREPGGSPFADRADFRARAFGVEVSGEGPPIIFIPGLGSPGEVWADTVLALEERYECHVLTLSGFAGRPPIDEPLSAAVRRDLTRYIRSRRLERPVIVGHSMGGFIALWLAASTPENIGALVVVDAGPALTGDLDEAKLLRSRWAEATDEEFAFQSKYMYTGMVTDKKRLEAISSLAAKSDRRTIGDAIYEMMVTDLTDRMPKIQAPVLFVLADGGLQQRIRKQVEGVRDKEIVVIPKARHFVMLDDPKRFVEAIEAFFETHPPGSPGSPGS
ncbi:MAG TPA: alpha/beta hydrolase [Kofleriaceae bacterium]|nr:alpha/beta hydrolase [Kofleriaceae bacterium]